jgi:hypothetical protein
MEETLFRLLEVDGVLGVLLLSHDGLLVASSNMEADEAEMVGALATAMIASMRATTERLAIGTLRQAELETELGRVRITILPELLLLLLLDHEVDRLTLEATMPEITNACLELVG